MTKGDDQVWFSHSLGKRPEAAKGGSMKIEPVGFLSTHNVEGPFKLQFHKTREEIYTDTCLRIDAVYTEPQLRQLVEACASKADDMEDNCNSVPIAIRELIKEMLP